MRAKLNWIKETYTPESEIEEKYLDYHAQGIGSITGTQTDYVVHNRVNVVYNGIKVTHE